MKQRIHVSWLLAWLCIGILAGLAAPKLAISFNPLILLPALVCLAIAFFSRKKAAVVLVLMAGLSIGLLRSSQLHQGLVQYGPYVGKVVTIQAVVAEDAAYSPEGEQRLRLKQIYIGDLQLPGTVWISTDSREQIKRGDRLIVSGRIAEGFGGNTAAIYRARIDDVVSRPNADVARQARDKFSSGVYESMSDQEANLGLGLLTGQKTNLPEELVNALRALGLTHIIVASGYNLTILVRLSRRVFSRVSRYLALFASGSLIAGFTLVTGFSPSMSRAALVAGLTLLAWYYGRRVHPLVLLPIAAAVTAFINPSYVRGDVGWYLSFASFAGVLVLAPLLERYFWAPESKPHLFRSVAIETFSAQLFTLPITLLIFGQFSLLALPANLLVLPLIPLAMLLTLIAGLGGLIIPSLGSFVGWPAATLLRIIEDIARWGAGLPWSKGDLSTNANFVFAAYALIAIVSVYLWRRTCLDFLKPTPD